MIRDYYSDDDEVLDPESDTSANRYNPSYDSSYSPAPPSEGGDAPTAPRRPEHEGGGYTGNPQAPAQPYPEEDEEGEYYEEEDERNDYFDTPARPEPKKEPKKPALKPDDPRYWDQEEDEFEHLRPRPSRRAWLWVALGGVIIGFLIGAYVRCFLPYVHSATQFGYVDEIESRGTLFKTFEGVILPYKNLMDSVRPYEGDFIFSTSDTDVAVTLRRALYAHRPVRVEYKVYRTVMPWRGDSRIVITAADTVDPRQILPPDRTPEFLK